MSKRDLSWEQQEASFYLLFKESGNPLYAWAAYSESRRVAREIPDWVLEYFDRASRNLLELCAAEKLSEEVSSAVAVAIEMKAPGKSGAGTMFTKARNTSDLEMVGGMLSYLEDGYKFGQAAETVAKDYDSSPTTVTRAWNKYFGGLRPSK